MKVTGLKTSICHAYRTNWVFVKVLTDAGLYGIGEATLETRERPVETAIQELGRHIVGRDPHDVEAFWHDAYRDAYWRGGPVLMSALVGVEMALWEIKGKDLGVDIDEEAIAQQPYEPRDLRHYRGDLTDIRPQDAVMYLSGG